MNRKLRGSLVAIAALVPGVCQAASPAPATRHVRDVVANGQAKSVGRLPATQSMRLVLVLPHRNQPELDNFLKELYDPSSPSYRHFLTVEEFTSRFGPTQEDYDAVVSFAKTGFETESHTQVLVQGDRTATVNGSLKVGAVAMPLALFAALGGAILMQMLVGQR